MIDLTTILMEKQRMQRRSGLANDPVCMTRLAMLAGVEIVAREDVSLLPDATDIEHIIGETDDVQDPAAILLDTNSSRNALFLVNCEDETVEARALIALAISNGALEPARRKITANARCVIVTLPSVETMTVESSGRTITCIAAGTSQRLDEEGQSLSFRPVASQGVKRLSLSLMVPEGDIQATGDWVACGSGEDRLNTHSAELANAMKAPFDWTRDEVARKMRQIGNAPRNDVDGIVKLDRRMVA